LGKGRCRRDGEDERERRGREFHDLSLLLPSVMLLEKAGAALMRGGGRAKTG
jgi:hypothetical protein